jgi:hypothetical protein
MSTSTDNAICQTLRVFYRWKYVHVDANWQRHLSDIENLLYVKVCSCRRQLTTPSVRHWEYFILYVHVDANCQTLRVFCRWKYVNVDANWQRHLSDIESFIGEIMFMSTPSVRHWESLLVKVCSCRHQLTTSTVRYWESFIGESMFMSSPTENAICQILRVFYMWKYVYVTTVWRLTLSEPVSMLISSLCE